MARDTNYDEYEDVAVYTFKPELITRVMQKVWSEGTKIRGGSDPASKMIAEYMRLFVQEGARRAAAEAKLEGSSTVTETHFQKILPQLLLDF